MTRATLLAILCAGLLAVACGDDGSGGGDAGSDDCSGSDCGQDGEYCWDYTWPTVWCTTMEGCVMWGGQQWSDLPCSQDTDQICCIDTAGGEPCPYYEGDNGCCGIWDRCEFAENGTCDCDGACDWDAIDCEESTDTETDAGA
jgi:hypothetical protein